MQQITHLILWLFIGALLVLVVTHGTGFASAVTAVGGNITSDAGLLTGGTVSHSATGATNVTPYAGG